MDFGLCFRISSVECQSGTVYDKTCYDACGGFLDEVKFACRSVCVIEFATTEALQPNAGGSSEPQDKVREVVIAVMAFLASLIPLIAAGYYAVRRVLNRGRAEDAVVTVSDSRL